MRKKLAGVSVAALTAMFLSGCAGIFDFVETVLAGPDRTRSPQMVAAIAAAPELPDALQSRPRPKPRPVLPVRYDDDTLVPAGAVAETEHAALPLGLTPGETGRRYGLPDNTEDLPPAQVWRYASAECVVEIFFYYDLHAATYRSLHVGVAPAAKDGSVRCIRWLAMAERNRPA